jgi:hypothetical protein
MSDHREPGLAPALAMIGGVGLSLLFALVAISALLGRFL